MSLSNIIKTDIVKSALKSVANSNDTKTTVLGAVASGVMLAQIDWGKLFQKDPTQIGLLVGAVVSGAFGYYTNKPTAPVGPKPKV